MLDRVPKGAVEVILSYCHHSLNDTSLLELLPYLQEKGVGVISASPLSLSLLSGKGWPEWHFAPPELKVFCTLQSHSFQAMVISFRVSCIHSSSRKG